MDFEMIHDEEMLYRAVKKSYVNPFVDGRPSPALFIDKSGLSVSRDGGRMDEDINQFFSEKFKDKEGNVDFLASLKISAENCRNAGTYPKPKPSTRDEYHAEIHESESVKVLSFPKAALLSRLCIIVK